MMDNDADASAAPKRHGCIPAHAAQGLLLRGNRRFTAHSATARIFASQTAPRTRPLKGLVAGILAPLVLACGFVGAAHAQNAGAGWREIDGAMRAAVYGVSGGEALFVLGCGPEGVFLQAPLPGGVKPRAGRGGALAFSVDGKRFNIRGRVAVDDSAESGAHAALVALIGRNDPLMRTLASGQILTLGKGRDARTIPLEDGRAMLGKVADTCGTAVARPEPSAPTSAVPAAASMADAMPARPASHDALPSPQVLAAAIFVDQAEGRRVADKLKITAVDLNGDGTPEAIVTLKDPAWCAETGCTWFVVDLSGTPRVMGQFIGINLAPGKTITNGWRELMLKTPGGMERMYYRDGAYH